MKKSKLVVLASMLMFGMLVGCGEQTSTPASFGTSVDNTSSAPTSTVAPSVVESVVIEGAEETLASGATLQLTAVVNMSSGSDVLGVTWSSSNEEVATVSETGLVTAKNLASETVVDITARSKKDNSKYATVSIKVLKDENVTIFGDKANMVEGEQAGAEANPGQVTYWAAKPEWGLGQATPDTATSMYTEGNTMYVSYTAEPSSQFFAMQIFYKNPNLQASKAYEVSMKITSSAPGSITINNKVVTLATGENDVTIAYNETALSLSIQFGTAETGVMKAFTGTFEITSWRDLTGTQQPLSAPTNIAVTPATALGDGMYTLTFDAVENAVGYVLSLYGADDQVLEGFDGVSAENNKTLNLTKVKTQELTVKVKALGDNLSHADSVYSQGVKFSHTKPETEPSVYVANFNQSTYGFVEKSTLASDTLGYWNDQWCCGSSVTVNSFTAKGQTIDFNIAAEGSCTFGFQMFYKNPMLEAGQTYTLAFKFTASAAGKIQVQNDQVDQALSYVKGVNEIKVPYLEGSVYTSMDIQFNVTGLSALVGKFEEVRWEVGDTANGTFITSTPSEEGETGGNQGEDGGSTSTESTLPNARLDVYLPTHANIFWDYIEGAATTTDKVSVVLTINDEEKACNINLLHQEGKAGVQIIGPSDVNLQEASYSITVTLTTAGGTTYKCTVTK